MVTDCNALMMAFKKIDINQRIARWTLALQEYDFELTHRSADKMRHVNALSRCVLWLTAPTVEDELRLRQISDSRIRKLEKSLEYKEDKRFVLQDDRVYRVLQDKLFFVVPTTMINNVIRIYHDEMGHVGLDKTIRGILSTYWFPCMRQTVTEHIQNCVLSNIPCTRVEREMSIVEEGNVLFETVHVDHFGPVEKTSSGYQYVLVIVDAFSRFTWLFATKSTGSAEAIQHLTYPFSGFGAPRRLISDRGTSFTLKQFELFIQQYGVQHVKIAVASP